MSKIVLITGATAGIGEATAKIFAKNNFNLILTGRRANKLSDLKNDITSEFPKVLIQTLQFDIRDKEATANAYNSLSEEWKNIDVLINNAGLAAGLDPIHTGSLEDWDQMIDTNVKGLLYITRLVTPGMTERRSGHIINVSSIAGKESYPNGSVYCGSKHAVSSITKAMRIDLAPFNVKVGAICPGMVETEFSLVRFKGDQGKADSVYQGVTPLYAEDIAETIYFMASRPAHVNIDDVLIMPTAQASSRDVVRNS
ncbi:SDR family oxidoreductase [Prolixibacteraceae bacterium JC049]|nr:SDR family oxidoreductase [Prolixibacteraceae bacterium JC049]